MTEEQGEQIQSPEENEGAPEEEIDTVEELMAEIDELGREIKETSKEEEEIEEEIKHLANVLKQLKIDFEGHPEELALLKEAEDSLMHLNPSSETERVTAKGRGSEENFSEVELMEQKKYEEKYKYSPEKFPTQEVYLDFLAQNLNSVQEINLFLKYLYRYDLTHEESGGIKQEYINNNPTADDLWRSPQTMATTYNEEARFFGDCEDIAILFEDILARQGKEPFFFLVPHHALTGWIEKGPDNNYVAHVVDTTTMESEGLGTAGCKTLTGEPGEGKEEVFSRLVNSFIKESDAFEKFSTSSMSLGFYIDEDHAYDIPTNFGLSQRYGELKSHLENQDYGEVIKILDEEIAKDPKSINLKTTKLQFLVLIEAEDTELTRVLNDITQLYSENLNNNKVIDDINRTAYFLLNNGHEEKAVQLFEPLMEQCNEVKFNLLYNDTLSDLYVGTKNWESAYQNDLRIIDEIQNIEKEAEKYGLAAKGKLTFWLGTADLNDFINPIKARLNSNPEYKEYVQQQTNVPEHFRALIRES